MTTLWPGTSVPSFSACSTIRYTLAQLLHAQTQTIPRTFAIRSLTDPPAEKYSHLPTTPDISIEDDFMYPKSLTQVAFETLLFRYSLQLDQRCMSDCVHGGIENTMPVMLMPGVCATGASGTLAVYHLAV